MSTDINRRRMLTLAGGAVATGVAGTALPVLAPGLAAADTVEHVPLAAEPNLEDACRWWPPARQVWTPVGWKGHLFRFNVFYNGDVICRPGPVLSAKSNVLPFADTNFQLTVNMPGLPNALPIIARPVWDDDSGWRQQGWQHDQQAPVLWTEFRRQEGLVIRESVFAHVPGGAELATGVEPHYAWVRFEVVHVDEVAAPDNFEFSLWLSKAFTRIDGPYSNEFGVVATRDPAMLPLDGPLRIDRIYNPTGKPIRVPVYDHDDQVRMTVLTSQGGSLSLQPNGVDGVYDLGLGLPVQVGATVDLVVPMLVADPEAAATEAGLGRDRALTEASAFWARRSPTAAVIRTPEPGINEFLHRSPQLAEVIAELSRDPNKPESPLRYSFLSGSHGYDVLWSTPTSMISHMFLDLLGYHDVVERHTEIYADMQGQQSPPGAIFGGRIYDGYFGTPSYLQAIDWLSDHGAILEIISRHALLTNDRDYIANWLDKIVKACDFIVEACALTDHNGVKGLFPPGFATDEGIDTQGVNVQCFTYKGMMSAIQLLRRENHPRAGEFAAFAARFRRTYQLALRDMATTVPTWTDSNGQQQPVLRPTFTDEPQPWIGMTRFDTGPLMSVWAGLMSARDPLMRSFMEFFRSGPDHALFDRAHHNGLDRVILEHEVGSGEPCYSWNVMHTHELGERSRYIEALYGLISYALSKDTYVSCEHRNAMWGNLFAEPVAVWTLRNAVVDDVLAADELHLLRMVPLAWVTEERTEFTGMPTIYGPVDVSWQLTGGRRPALDITVRGHWHHRPDVLLTVPPLPGPTHLRVNGRPTPMPRGQHRTIRL